MNIENKAPDVVYLYFRDIQFPSPGKAAPGLFLIGG